MEDSFRLQRLESDVNKLTSRVDGYSDRIREVERREAGDSIKLDNLIQKMDDLEEKVDQRWGETNRRLVGIALSFAGSAITFAFVVMATLR